MCGASNRFISQNYPLREESPFTTPNFLFRFLSGTRKSAHTGLILLNLFLLPAVKDIFLFRVFADGVPIASSVPYLLCARKFRISTGPEREDSSCVELAPFS